MSAVLPYSGSNGTDTLQRIFPGNNEMARRMCSFDWSQTALGPPESWPQSLKTCLRIMLASRQSMAVWWGESFINLYNDHYAAFLGIKHPEALGQPAASVWSEAWEELGPRAEFTRCCNEGIYDEAQPFILRRHGYPEEEYLTISYTPIPNDDGGVGGLLCTVSDETQRIIAERQQMPWIDVMHAPDQALRENEERLKFALEISHTGAWDLDLVDHTAFRSLEHDRIFGYSELLPLWTYEMFLEHVVPEDRALVDAAFRQATAEVSDWSFECRIRRVDGQTRWIWAAGRHRSDASGQPRWMAGIVQDITERKLAELALQWNARKDELLSQTAARLLENDNPQGLVESLCREIMVFLDCHAFFNFLVDEQAGRLHLNACAGIPQAEAQRIEWLDYGVAVCGCVARDGRRIIAEDILNTEDLRTELVKSYGIQAYCCHPLQIQGRLIGTLSFGTRSRPYFSSDEIGIMRAVTDLVAIAMNRIATEKALRDSEERYRALITTSSQVVYRMSPDWVELRQLYGRGFVADTGAPTRAWLQEYILPEDQAHVTAVVNEAIRTKSIFELEHRVRRADGSLGWTFSRAVPLMDATGEIVEWFGAASDITERKHAEEMLKANLAALTRMHKLSERRMDATGLAPLLEDIMDTAIAIVGAERGTLQLFEGDALRIVAQHGHQASFLEFFADAKNQPSACAEALRRMERVVIPDVQISPIFAGTRSLEILRDAGVRAVQSTPITSRSGAVLGILTTHSSIQHSPDEQDL